LPTPKPEVMLKPPPERVNCRTCAYKHGELNKWIGETLRLTREAGETRPTTRALYLRLEELFPGYHNVARHVNTLGNHLQLHEAEWTKGW
jgi:hypothetical protein